MGLVLKGSLLISVACGLLSEDASGAMCVLLGDESAAVGNGVPWRSVLVENIDGFEGETLGFRHTEVGEDEAANASRAPEEEDLNAEISVTGSGVDEVGS